MHTPARPDVFTHLKLQKLEFYCYGALLALDLDEELGDISFQAWKHGPVSPAVFEHYRAYKGEALPKPSSAARFSERITSALTSIVNIYGRMTAWQLREESHSESPWESVYTGTLHTPILKDDMRAHFIGKFRGPSVSFPERLFGGSSMLLDRIPVPTFSSLDVMSQAATRILGA
jgi:uncharacterized phage-associated protein